MYNLGIIQWIFSRVAVIYLVLLLFCLTCVDMKMLRMRVKVRHLNDAIPDFTEMILFSKDRDVPKNIDWKPYKDYFQLILRYMPDDVIVDNLLGYIDHYSGNETGAIDLFKKSSVLNGRDLLLSNYNLGAIYYKKGMWPQAAEYFLKAVSSNTKLASILMQANIVYRQIFINQYFKYSLDDEAKETQSRAYVLLLSSLNNMRQFDKMIGMAKLGISNPDFLYKDAFYYYAGLGFLQEGQEEKAFLLLQKSLTIEKDNPDVYFYIANIYQNLGQEQEAKAFFQASYVLHQKNDPRFPYDKDVELCFF